MESHARPEAEGLPFLVAHCGRGLGAPQSKEGVKTSLARNIRCLLDLNQAQDPSARLAVEYHLPPAGGWGGCEMKQPAFAIPLGWRHERYLIAVWYSLPFCLYLPYDHYELAITHLNEGRPALIELDKRGRDLEIAFRMLPPGRGEMWRDARGKFRYSAAVVWMPYTNETSLDPGHLMRSIPKDLFRSFALQYLNRLIRVYRFVTADYYIPALSLEDVGDYFGIGLADTASRRPKIEWRPMGRMEPDVNLLPDKPPSQLCKIRDMLRSEAPIPDEEELLMSARALLDSGSPRLAVLDAQTAFEVVVDRLVATHYRGLRYTNEKIQAILDCGFKNLVKHHLSPHIRRFEQGMPVHDDYWAKSYKPRCKLAHGERTEITDDEAEQAIRCVEEALEYLIGRAHDRIWPPQHPGIRLM